MKAGSRILMTLEPNFLIGTGGRLTIKDLFKPGVAIDRVFTFQGNGCWGFATLEPKGNVTPRPVRLADGREFAVRMEQGLPVVDWTGLIKSDLPEGFKPIRFTMPRGRLRVAESLCPRRHRGPAAPDVPFPHQGRARRQVGRADDDVGPPARPAAAGRRVHVAGVLSQGHRPAAPRLGGQ